MSRPLRINEAGLTYHVHARGNGRMTIFLDDVDRSMFLEVLATVTQEEGVLCHAYCEMDTHYHVLVTTTLPNISSAIKALNGEYARWWNHRHDHVGHVFQGRFHSKVVQDGAYLLDASRYIVRNPVRAGMFATPDQWKWSSYLATAALIPVPEFLSPRLVWESVGGGDDAPWKYAAFVNSVTREPELPPGPILGDAQFQARFAQWFERAGPEVSRRERPALPPLEAVCADASTRAARVQAILQAREAGYLHSEIAHHLGVHRSTISRVLIRLGLTGAPRCSISRPDPAGG